MLPGSKAYARMTAGGALPAGTPLYRHPLSLARGSRAKSPYFSGGQGRKSGIHFPGSKAFARMTAGEVLPAVDFFTGGDVSYPLKAVLFFLDSRFRKHDGAGEARRTDEGVLQATRGR